MEQQCILLYSKYSQHSKRLMDMLKQSSVDLTNIIKLNSLCVDNEEIRERIVNCKKLDISCVPCILVVYKDGGVEKYEGTTAFKWIEEIIRSFTPPPIQQPPTPIIQKPTKKVIKPPKKFTKKQIIAQAQQSTSIDDLESEEEDNQYEEDNRYEEEKLKPPMGIRTNAGNYEMQETFGKTEEPIRTVKKGIKSSTEPGTGGGKGNLMATAMAMQKLRENDDTRPKGTPPDRM